MCTDKSKDPKEVYEQISADVKTVQNEGIPSELVLEMLRMVSKSTGIKYDLISRGIV